jgi:gamma-glutamyltranspeptidase/glutathione hydrolase
VPAAADAWLTALEKYGTMTFEQVVTPALDLAENGFPLSAYLINYLGNAAETDQEGSLSIWDSTRDVFMPNGRVPLVGEPLMQSDLAHTFKRLIEIERGSLHSGREAAIRAARDHFYKGEIAEEMARFSQEHGGLLSLEDLKDFSVSVEEPEIGRFRDYTVYTCGPWCQGPVVAQTLQMLSDDDLAALGHNSADYIHLISQTLTDSQFSLLRSGALLR